MGLGVLDILALSGYNRGCKARFVRHQSADDPVAELRRHGWYELYQRYQSKPRFHGVKESVVSFYGVSGTRAAFDGVYQVGGWRPAAEGPTPPSCPRSVAWKQFTQEKGGYFYDLERDPRFDDLRDRLIIEWGAGALAWVQKPTNKEVVEILAPGRILPPFDDYLEFSLTHDQLRDLFVHEDAHRDWRAQLQAVGGVYLILAQTTGDQYVGSASGDEGIWGRWREYARSGDGANVRLRGLIRRDPAYPKAFRFSVLQIVPKTMARSRVIEREALYKQKLGSRAIGLNLN